MVRRNTDKGTGLYPMPAAQDEQITRTRILETIDRLFYRQGIRAVGVHDEPGESAHVRRGQRVLLLHGPTGDVRQGRLLPICRVAMPARRRLSPRLLVL